MASQGSRSAHQTRPITAITANGIGTAGTPSIEAICRCVTASGGAMLNGPRADRRRIDSVARATSS